MKKIKLAQLLVFLSIVLLVLWNVRLELQSQSSTMVYDISKYGAKPDDKQFDNAKIINDIIQKIGVSGGTIYIPTGNFYLKSSIMIDRSYINIVGEGSGLRSGIDEGTSKSQALGGGSRLILQSGVSGIQVVDEENKSRLTGIQFKNFQLHGEENNGIGIEAKQDTDGIVVENLVIKNVGIGIYLLGADAPSIRDSWIAETKSSIIMAGASQQANISQNFLGAQPEGVTLALENAQWFTITSNNIFPDGASSIRLYNPQNGTISSNTISSYYVGIVELLPNKNGQVGRGNLISSNNISLKDYKTNPERKKFDWGLIHIEGDANYITNNLIDGGTIGEDFNIISVKNGQQNQLRSNHIVSERTLSEPISIYSTESNTFIE
ncbi:TPA: right-handed parallel beta-helix repeat-containing protein [Streptococcus suis]|nr:right-handed parallel beta-helix repeat-containing protein [Streptococcus suis]